MKSSFRFDPPPIDWGSEVPWLIAAAFAAVPPPSSDPIDGASAVATGRTLDLLARIGARFDEADLADVVGGEWAGHFKAQARSTAGQGLRARAMAGQLGRIAQAAGIDAVIAKGGALLVLDAVPAGARNVGDLDILVPRDSARGFQEELRNAGWVESDLPESSHQLPILGHKSGVAVEVHTALPGVCIESGDATAEDVRKHGLYRERSGCQVVRDDLLLAHLVAHGIHQHGLAPMAYPMARMLADVQDLVASRVEWEEFIDGGYRWISHVVSRREAEAVWALVDRLGVGEDPAAVMGLDDDAGKLLRHIVAGAFDEDYRRSLKLQDAARASGDSSWFEAGKKALFLTRGQIDVVYGKPASELGYLGRRAWRPFDLVLRAGRYGWAWVKRKMRRR